MIEPLLRRCARLQYQLVARVLFGVSSWSVVLGLWRGVIQEGSMDSVGSVDWIKTGFQVLLLVAAFGFLAFLVYAFFKSKPDTIAEDSAVMPVVARRILVWYLILLGLSLVYVMAHVTAADFPEGGLSAEIARATDTRTEANAPALEQVYPQTNRDDPTVIDLVLFGHNFTKESKVCVKRLEKTPVFIGPQHLQARVEQANIVGLEPLDIFIVNPKPAAAAEGAAGAGSTTASPCTAPSDYLPSNSFGIIVRKARAEVSLFGARVWMGRELQLILLALLAGALGSYVHALKSLSDFVGNRTLTASWFWWYVTRPFLGAAMALIFYAVLRGGFLAGTPADAKVVNPFGVVAICALVGMFADKAAQKLGEIFDTLFTAKDSRGGKLAAPAIDKLDPDHVTAGTKAPTPLKIQGDRLGRVTKVMFDKTERLPDSVSDKLVSVMLQPDDMKQPRDVLVSVVDPDGASPAAPLHVVTDLSIVPPVGSVGDNLADATHGQPYRLTFTAKGGAAPYAWEMPASAGFTLDAQGNLIGTPAAAGDLTMPVKVTDANKVAVSHEFKVKIN